MTELRWGTPAARWVVAASALGSGIAFLDSTVVNVALPTIADDLDAGVAGLQWTVDAYLVTLTALLLLGGSVGDRYGRKRGFLAGLAVFVAASAACGAAPNIEVLVAARAVQGAGAAFLVPNSLSIISASFDDDHRGPAIGAWSGLTGVSSAIGPFLGGWLIDSVSWRLVFLINVPLAAVTAWIAARHVPESSADVRQPLDASGAVAVSVGLAGLSFTFIEGANGFGLAEIVAALLGATGLVAFVLIEWSKHAPMLPLTMFRSAQFTGANLTTLTVYGGLGGALFLVVLYLQVALGYSALEAGAAFLPLTVLMLLLSARAGELAQRIGPRLPMTVGPIVAGAGLVLLAGISPGDDYVRHVLPGVVVFAAGMTLTVAPLTSTVMAAVDRSHLGVASGTNNAISRLAGLLAVAVLPWAAGISTLDDLAELEDGYPLAMRISGALCVVGGALAFLTIRTGVHVTPQLRPSMNMSCEDPCVAMPQRAGRGGNA
jgi:EmrB/QacA subfamily drug resistance transporter